MTDWPKADWDHGGHRLFHADCLTALPTLPADSVTALVTDPPAGIEFMGLEFDTFRGDKRQPGDATFHKSGVGPFDRAKVRHGTSSGYGNGSARETFVSTLTAAFAECLRVVRPGGYGLVWAIPRTSHWTATALEDAGWEIRDRISHLFGQGFPKAKSCLKPACEDWWLVRKPGRKVGSLNIDGCRIAGDNPSIQRRETARRTGNAPVHTRPAAEAQAEGRMENRSRPEVYMKDKPEEALGRWPANVTLDESAAAMLDRMSGDCPSGSAHLLRRGATTGNGIGYGSGANGHDVADATYGDSGGASRFLYVAKADRSDRERGNSHPTVKSTALMRWLVRLVTPEGGIVLDPFMGSGSTGKAAVRERCQFVGIEREEKYYRSAVKRVYRAVSEPDLFKPVESPPPAETADLFGGNP